jgi:sugar/nucleoside kinase (ribokinase family)
MQPYDLLVAGEINPDLILSGDVMPAFGQVEKLVDDAILTVGSSSAIFACGAARLGLRVAFVGVCGADIFGRYMLDEMSARGVDVAHAIVDPAQRTGLSVILNRGSDRAILTHAGAMSALRAGQIEDSLLKQARHLHVASYFLQTLLRPDLPALFRRAHAFGLTTSLDTNWDPSEEWSGFEQLLPLVDVFLPNEHEAQAIAGCSQLDPALAKLARWSGVVAVKLGGRGGVARRGDQLANAASLPVRVIDTVGAGDTFDAGFLYGYLAGWGLERSLRLACACGSLSTQKAGGVAGQPSFEEALQWI